MDISELVGKTIATIENLGDDLGDELIFTLDSGEQYRFYHESDCCENVRIEDIVGDLDDLTGSPLTMAEEVTSDNENPPDVTPPDYQDSFTWTFYKFATVNGYVTIRWYGESNGYYSESVNVVKRASESDCWSDPWD